MSERLTTISRTKAEWRISSTAYDMQRLIELSANLALLIVCIFAGYRVLSSSPGDSGRVAPRPESFQVGEEVSVLETPRSVPNENASTLTLVLHSQCRYGTASLPFYRKLAELRASDPRLRLVVIGVEPEASIAKYLTAHDVKVDRLIATNHQRFYVRGTPTILLTTPDGILRKVWRGQASPGVEAAIIASWQNGPDRP